jgi:hypothetical protein
VKAFIQLICRAHIERDRRGPFITLVDGVWAYCEGHGSGGHDWMGIEPTRREHLGDVTQLVGAPAT